jgi:tripartite-type tricarboxylate transporter receptor subunit TctC
MNRSRRQIVQLSAAAIATAVGFRRVSAQGYPTRPVRIIVGLPPGGITDITARLLGQSLSERLGQQFIVENRSGAVTNIATEAALRASADGYTLLLSTAFNAINASVYQKLSFNFIRDSAAVAAINDTPLVLLVQPSFPAQSLPTFISYAKANTKLTMASAGIGSPEHVTGALFALTTGIEMIHVPYRGSAPALSDLLSGQVHFYFGPIGSAIEYLRSGALRALAVTAATRLETLPDVPAVDEFLPGFEVTVWQGLSAPKGTPTEIIERLNREVNAALGEPKLRQRLVELGTTVPPPASPADFERLVIASTEKWAKVAKSAGIKAD